MKMLTNKQIEFYLKMAKRKSKKAKKKAYSRLGKDFKKFGAYRFEMCMQMYEEIFGDN